MRTDRENQKAGARLSIWIAAARPRTLPMALSPVFVGACFAAAFSQRVAALAVVLAAFSAICIQIATNLYNDARDFERGADGPGRLGPLRAAAAGLLSPRALKRAAFGSFALAALAGVYLVAVGGWPILLLGLASILAGWAYAGGPAPISYSPFGELFVILFFGLGAVAGAYWLGARALTPEPLLAGLALGLFAAGVLMVNNYRDAAQDAQAGRRTLAIVVGDAWARRLFAAALLAPFALLGLMIAAAPDRALWLAFAAALPAALQIRALWTAPRGPGLNRVLAQTAQTQAVFALLLGLGALT